MQRLRILVTGSTGFLAPVVGAAARASGLDVGTSARAGGDVPRNLDGEDAVDALLAQVRPDVVVHLAAMARLQDCEADAALAQRTNATVPGRFAERIGARCLFVSTDLVFDGRRAPYGPTAPVEPLSEYGRSKAHGEVMVRANGGRVVRLPLLFG
ncbi:MAG: sugar nucleotide-binding protein, partial [Planctomycetes bacterium]|nr:sugar nucleotide-binding protein [Planctomycetota bacterium]